MLLARSFSFIYSIKYEYIEMLPQLSEAEILGFQRFIFYTINK